MATVVVATAFGGPEVLSLISEPVGDPGPGEAVIEVRAAGVNPVDHKLYSGTYGASPPPLPLRIGFEAAGVITALGQGDTGAFGVGDEVIAYRATGAYASDLRGPTTTLTPKPGRLGWAEAAGLMLTGATAVHALTVTDVQAGQTVLIHGGSGGVGQMAVQLAVLRGARVIATASPARHDLLRGLGAIPVAYGPGLADRVREVAPDGVDAALELVGTDEAIDASLELVADRERIVEIANARRGLAEGIKVIGGAPGADPGVAIRDAARAELAALAGDGKLHVTVAASYPLDRVADAHREILAGHTTGKIVLIP